MSFTRDPAAAVCEALAVYLAATLPTYAVLRGWPESDVRLDLAYPVVSVFNVGALADETIQPTTLDATTLALGLLTIAIQLDVWAAYRETLDAAVQAVSLALQNDLPWRPALYLTATDYGGRTFVVTRENDGPERDGETAPLGQWRHTFTLSASIERVATYAPPVVVSIDTPVTPS